MRAASSGDRSSSSYPQPQNRSRRRWESVAKSLKPPLPFCWLAYTASVCVAAQGSISAGPWRKEYGLEINARLRRWPKNPQAEIDRIGAVAASTYRLGPGQIVRVQLYQESKTGFSAIWKSWMDYYEPCWTPPRGPAPGKTRAG